MSNKNKTMTIKLLNVLFSLKDDQQNVKSENLKKVNVNYLQSCFKPSHSFCIRTCFLCTSGIFNKHIFKFW